MVGLKLPEKRQKRHMNAQLIVDINSKKDKSRFIKTAPSVFGLNEGFIALEKIEVKKTEKVWTISKDVSTRQKGDIAEGRIAELITLYGDTTLSCYKPISDDEGIDLIVKEKVVYEQCIFKSKVASAIILMKFLLPQ